ncbi:MAG: Vir protein [Legionellaceae bacterium]|nr:Vir protein [Legionellaceae bacterium]
MFSRFAAFYGHVWRSQFKHEEFLAFAKKEWQEGLCRFSDDVLEQAIITCRDFCEMPPTLPQVITHCRQIKKRNAFYVAGNDYTPAKPEIIQQYLRQCKDMLITQ